MLTKYVLNFDGQDYELGPEDVKNWDEIMCTYKRVDFGGVVRSFTSRFEFVNNAYKMMMALFDRKGHFAHASVSVYVIDNNWNWQLEHMSDLDFSTLIYDDYVLSMYTIDSSVANNIKSNKSTKYEFVVGEDVPTNGFQYLFDRVRMVETASYAISDGESQDDGSLIGSYSTSNNHRIYVGNTGHEIAVGGFILPEEDQTYGDGYMIMGKKSCDITLDYSIAVGSEEGCAPLVLMRNNAEIAQLHPGASALKGKQFRPGIPNWSSIDAVMDYIMADAYLSHDWATETWDNWVIVQGIVWTVEVDGMLGNNMWVCTGKTKAEYFRREMSAKITFKIYPGDKIWLKFASETDRVFKIYDSELKFTWTARGDSVLIDSIAPDELLERLLWKMGIGYDCYIDDFSKTFGNILILPAESIRAIPGAKIYVSFNDFCNWMETVFGYTYVINDEMGIIEFKHRNKIFSAKAEVIEIENAKDFEYKTETSVLYSSVVVGYEKKDYDSVNGRDEFNFNTTYTTGYNNGKKLELKSPFRADSYGIEFLVEKRSQDTTDNGSDKDVFFVTGVEKNGYYYTNRKPNITNSITGTLINGEFSPVHCAFVNAEYISIMAYSLDLTFASTEGNGNIQIDGIGISDDITLEDCEMLTAGELKFVCGDMDIPKDINCLIRVKSRDFIYEGFIREVSFALARPEAVEYTIMIKTKTPC